MLYQVLGHVITWTFSLAPVMEFEQAWLPTPLLSGVVHPPFSKYRFQVLTKWKQMLDLVAIIVILIFLVLDHTCSAWRVMVYWGANLASEDGLSAFAKSLALEQFFFFFC